MPRGPDRRPRRLRRERRPASETVERTRRIDIRKWKRAGLLMIGYTFRNVLPRTGETIFVTRQPRHIRLGWENDHGQQLTQQVRVIEHDRIVRGYVRGGSRASRRGIQRVFGCSGCGRGCCLLYLSHRGWTCQQCAGLIYASERLNNQARRERHLRKIQRTLGMDTDRLAEKLIRPARMRRSTLARDEKTFWKVRSRWKLRMSDRQFRRNVASGRGRSY
jgi:hypothetical protein